MIYPRFAYRHVWITDISTTITIKNELIIEMLNIQTQGESWHVKSLSRLKQQSVKFVSECKLSLQQQRRLDNCNVIHVSPVEW